MATIKDAATRAKIKDDVKAKVTALQEATKKKIQALAAPFHSWYSTGI